MTTPLTDVEKIGRLPWLIAGDALNMAFVLLTFAGPVFLLFLDELGLDNAQIGFLLSLIPFCSIIAPFVASAIARRGYKRMFLTFRFSRKFIMALLLLTPLILTRLGAEAAFYWVAVILFCFALVRAVGETAGFPWRKEVVPDSIRGKFSAINSMTTTAASILVTAGAGYLIDVGTGLGRFMVLIAIGVGLGLVSIWTFSHIPGGAPVPGDEAGAGDLAEMGRTLRDREFVIFLLALGLVEMGGTAIIAFIPLFMKSQVGLSEGLVVLLSVGTYAGSLLSSFLWGWTADRYGSKPIMQSSQALMLFLPLAWFMMPRASQWSAPLAIGIAFGAGVATLAWQISWARYLYVNATPAEKKTPYMAVFFAWYGLVSGLGPLLAGQVLEASQNLGGRFFIFSLDPYTPLFILSFILLTAGFLTVSRLRSDEATPFRRFTGMFLRGNMIRAIESLIQYNFAGDELSRIATTERMGDAKSPLSTQELVEALNDPSFNVRYEAIHSIGRMPPEPELVEALLALLEEPASELSFVVTRSLGRLGDPRAIPPLRRLLFSGYHLIEANSARALAMLGDGESAPLILEKFRAEPNKVLRIAYASALGTLRVTEAVEEIFGLLRETRAESLRAELGLALARIAGEEQYYMHHWRALRANPDTATAQALLALQKLARQPALADFAAQAGRCAQAFARGDSAAGVKLLQALPDRLPAPGQEDRVATVLRGCRHSLADCGPARLELILLALHTLDIALRQINSGEGAA